MSNEGFVKGCAGSSQWCSELSLRFKTQGLLLVIPKGPSAVLETKLGSAPCKVSSLFVKWMEFVLQNTWSSYDTKAKCFLKKFLLKKKISAEMLHIFNRSYFQVFASMFIVFNAMFLKCLKVLSWQTWDFFIHSKFLHLETIYELLLSVGH